MARPAKKQTEAASANPAAEPNTFVLGERTFTVRPMNERDPEYAYDDSAEFIIEALPILIKIMGLTDNLSAAGSLDDVNEFDVQRLARDFTGILPRLVSIVCNGDDREVTESDVKKWAASPLNPNLIKAVVLQIKADKIMDQIGEIKATASELNAAA